MVEEAFKKGDQNGNKKLSLDEFMELADADRHEREKDAEDLYHKFTKDHEEGMTMEGLRAAWTHAEGGRKIPMKKVKEAFSHGDQNDNGRLSLNEFKYLVEEGAKAEEGKYYEDHSEADKFWDMYAKNPEKGMNKREFNDGYKEQKKDATTKETREVWKYINLDKNKTLSKFEFRLMFQLKEDLIPGDDDVQEKIEWYWRNFVQHKKEGMTMNEWMTGSMLENGEEMM